LGDVNGIGTAPGFEVVYHHLAQVILSTPSKQMPGGYTKLLLLLGEHITIK